MQIVKTKSGYYVYAKTGIAGRKRRIRGRLLTKKQAKGVKNGRSRKK